MTLLLSYYEILNQSTESTRRVIDIENFEYMYQCGRCYK